MSHMGHAPHESRNSLIAGIRATESSGTAERTATLEMVDALKSKHRKKPETLGADKGHDRGEFLSGLEKRSLEPHVPPVKERVTWRVWRTGSKKCESKRGG